MRNLKYLLGLSLLLFFVSCSHEPPAGKVSGKNTPPPAGVVSSATIIKIGPEQLLKMLKYDKKAMVIDVRKPNPSIRACKLIRGYRHLYDSLIYKNPGLLPQNKSIILISKDGKRSLKLANFLLRKNISVYVLEGGMDAYWAWREKIIRDKLKIYDKQIDVIELFSDDFGC